jgi:UrcA family protein
MRPHALPLAVREAFAFHLLTDIVATHCTSSIPSLDTIQGEQSMKTSTKLRSIPALGRISKTLIIAGGAMALAAHSPRAAVAAESVQQVTVRYDDLNLSSESGINALKQRIRRAAEIVCGEGDTRDARGLTQHNKCVRDAADTALTRVNWRRN